MTKQGWVAVHRQIQDHWLWEEKPFSKGQAWIDMLLLANHADKKFCLGNELIEVKQGSFITSELKLAEKWGWSKTKVRAFLTLLQTDEMIVKKSDNKKTAITIVNYSDYAVFETAEKPQKNNKKTAEKPQKNTNNNDNNYNNDNNSKEKINKKESRHKYGEYKNVLLSDEELEKLKTEFPVDWTDRIENLSSYIASTGKTYKSHLATIRNWARKEKPKKPTAAKNGYDSFMEQLAAMREE